MLNNDAIADFQVQQKYIERCLFIQSQTSYKIECLASNFIAYDIIASRVGSMTRKIYFFLTCSLFIAITDQSHYRGGTFTWKPVSFHRECSSILLYHLQVNPTDPTQNPVLISFTQRHAWRRGFYYCDQTTINSGGIIGAGSVCCVGSQCGSMGCPLGVGVPCTDFSVSQDTSAGQASSLLNISRNVMIALQFSGGAWIALNTGGGNWAVTTQIRLLHSSYILK